MNKAPKRPSHLLPTIRIGDKRRRLIYALFAILLISGSVWLYLHFFAGAEMAFTPSPLLPWSMKVHGAAALLLTYFAGSLLYSHILHAWHIRRNRWSGSVIAVSCSLLALTGYGLYYFDGEQLRQSTEWLHWMVGGIALPVLYWHIRMGRRRKSQNGSI
ncbi:hypothetical protein [Andreprevotia chitinilytica]|uniref:hypothetical protein n=1 Tax=Andreprevotia chitinilytica TaxID=396808 RepID=UPI000553D351|nr:hypothetical protein [Andreprevotia chitinilytica]